MLDKRVSQNSLVQEKTLELLHGFFVDLIASHQFASRDLHKDENTITKRVSHEGISFLTQTMPTLGKAITKSFSTGTFVCPTGFSKMKGTALPRFLGGLLKRVYKQNGELRRDLDQVVLTDLYQLTLMFYKLDLPYSKTKEQKVIENFVDVEGELERLQLDADDPILADAASLAARILNKLDRETLLPKHGPGAVATRERDEQKWEFKRKYMAIHRQFPYYEFFTPTRRSLLSRLQWYKSLEILDSGQAKVTLVPKDSRGPRLISMEPLEYQFIQQAIAGQMVQKIQRHPLTRGLVNFTDQSVNRKLAFYNSITQAYSTLDMKEASDRVSLALVQQVFKNTPDWLKAFEATRSTSTELPDGRVIQLRKFAPMGSALCFPVEALVFWLLATVIKEREGIRGRVYVYGDDIIVPKALAPKLLELFPQYGLKFNEDKCFTVGSFRESCGCDAFKGIVITPIRLRRVPCTAKQATSLASYAAFSNYLWSRGYWKSSQVVTEQIRELIPSFGKILVGPNVEGNTFDALSFTMKGVQARGLKVRFRKSLQRLELLTPTLVAKQRKSTLKGDERLFRDLITQPGLFYRLTDTDEGRRDDVTVPHAVKIKMRWTPLYRAVGTCSLDRV
jgi:hypothetical protein